MAEKRYRETEPLKKGELVVMHTCVEARNPKYEGKIWTCRTDQFTTGKGAYEQDSVFLEGFSGSFAPEYLQRVDVGTVLAEKDAAMKGLQQANKVLKDALETIWSNSDEQGAIDCAAEALDTIKLIGKLKAGDKIRQKLTQFEGELVDIQYEHDRYQIKGISGWIYGVSDLEVLSL